MTPNFSQATALVIEGNPLARSVLVRMLSELGFSPITQTRQPKEALKLLERQSYDFIFCEYHFESSIYTGQAFVADLRHNRLLALTTAFVMVTGEAARSKVSEAAESALDSYVLKPFTPNELSTRLKEVRSRKEHFNHVFTEISLNSFSTAIIACETMVQAKSKYWVHAARIAAELLLCQEEFGRAAKLFEEVVQTNAVPWAKLGLARVDLEEGKVAKATRALESLVSEHPAYADAYDLMGRALLHQGELAKAIEVYRRAVEITPASVSRLQKLGALAFLQGDPALAQGALDAAFRLGAGSQIYDYQSLVLLAFVRFDSKESKFMRTAASLLSQQLVNAPESFRLNFMHEVVMVLSSLQARHLPRVSEGVTKLAAMIKHPQFDFESACNFLSLLSRVSACDLNLSDKDLWVASLAGRFCTTKASTEILSKCVPPESEHVPVLVTSLTAVTQATQAALLKSLKGECQDAVQDLLAHGTRSLNAKILEVASLVAERYKGKLENFKDLTGKLDALRNEFCSQGTQAGLSGPPGTGPRRAKGSPAAATQGASETFS